MSSLHPIKLISALKTLGQMLTNPGADLSAIIESAQHHNAWFTPDEVKKSLNSLGQMLNETELDHWFSTITFTNRPKNIGLILAGNIPLVGFHDVLCV